MEYGDNIAAVILVKTRKNFTGTQGGVRLSQAVTTVSGNGYAYLNMNTAKDRYAIFLSESNSYSNGSSKENSKLLHYPDHTLNLDVFYTRTSPEGKLLVADLTTTYIATNYGQDYMKRYLMDGYSDYSNSYTADGHHGSIIGEAKYSLPVFGRKHKLAFGSRDNDSDVMK